MGKEAFVTKEKIAEIEKEYPTPFYVYDEKLLRKRLSDIKEAFSWNKGYKEYFAVKANPNPFLLKIMKEYGAGCDCSSLTELMLAKACGFTGDDIMFSSNETPAQDYLYAKECGAIVNLDDFTHIDYVDRLMGLDKTMSLRFNPGGVFELGNGIMDNPGDAKYGMTREQIIDGIKIMMSKGVERFGLHAFLASNTVTNDYYPLLAAKLFKLALEVRNETGCRIAFINLSGGVGVAYRPDQEPNDIFKIAKGVEEAYNRILVPEGMGDVAIYTEMGRFVAAECGALVTKAIHEKHIHKEYIGVDACAVNLMRPAMYGAYHHITVLGKEDALKDHVYDVVGSLCENSDKFAIDRNLPKIDKGDYIFIHDAGAHGYSMGYNYNGKLKCAEILLTKEGTYKLIRRAETPKDYFATLDCFDINLEV